MVHLPMEVRMERTDGLGRRAEVWVGGNLLEVCDGVSKPDKPCLPGVIEPVRFSYVTEMGHTWEQATRGNPSHRRKLEPIRGWTYSGFGRIVQVMPVLVDFGLLTMEDPNWSNDESLVGKFVKIAIDRLEISWAYSSDWPEGAR